MAPMNPTPGILTTALSPHMEWFSVTNGVFCDRSDGTALLRLGYERWQLLSWTFSLASGCRGCHAARSLWRGLCGKNWGLLLTASSELGGRSSASVDSRGNCSFSGRLHRYLMRSAARTTQRGGSYAPDYQTRCEIMLVLLSC